MKALLQYLGQFFCWFSQFLLSVVYRIVLVVVIFLYFLYINNDIVSIGWKIMPLKTMNLYPIFSVLLGLIILLFSTNILAIIIGPFKEDRCLFYYKRYLNNGFIETEKEIYKLTFYFFFLLLHIITSVIFIVLSLFLLALYLLIELKKKSKFYLTLSGIIIGLIVGSLQWDTGAITMIFFGTTTMSGYIGIPFLFKKIDPLLLVKMI